MKKLLVVLVLIMVVLAVNAQAKTTGTKVTPERNVVMVADLHKNITDNIAKDYVGFTTKEATKVTTNGIVKYEVVVVKGTTTETLVYDNDGKFVKKISKAPKK